MDDYKNQFDLLALKVHHLPDEHKLSHFSGGLKNEIRLPVWMFNPKTSEAYSLGHIQKECISNLTKGLIPQWRSTPFSSSTRSMSSKFLIVEGKGPPSRTNPLGQNRLTTPFPGRHGSNPTKSLNPNQALVPVQKITQAQMEDRRKRALCYSYDAKWTRGHVCAVPKLFLIKAVQKEEEGDTARAVFTEEDPSEFFLEEFPEISLNTITGTPNSKTMRIIGFIRFD